LQRAISLRNFNHEDNHIVPKPSQNGGKKKRPSVIWQQNPPQAMIERSLKVQLPTIWTHGKAEVGRVREEKGIRKKNQRRKAEDRRSRCAKR